MNDIVINKKESIERCLKQVRDYYALVSDKPFAEDHLKQDAIALNLHRACEQCIDLAHHAIKVRKLGLPQSSRESFRLLSEGGLIPRELSDKLERMVGFRNVLVHQYRQLDLDMMIDIIENHLDNLLEFTDLMVKELFDGPA